MLIHRIHTAAFLDCAFYIDKLLVFSETIHVKLLQIFKSFFLSGFVGLSRVLSDSQRISLCNQISALNLEKPTFFTSYWQNKILENNENTEITLSGFVGLCRAFLKSTLKLHFFMTVKFSLDRSRGNCKNAKSCVIRLLAC